jgi:hypothetical protein
MPNPQNPNQDQSKSRQPPGNPQRQDTQQRQAKGRTQDTSPQSRERDIQDKHSGRRDR